MRRSLQKFPSLIARSFFYSPANFRHSNTNPCVVPSLDRVTSRFVFFSSEPDSARGSKIDDVVSKEELKKRIQSFFDDGDEDALPDLFEAMMNRKLSGMHDESDDEVMEEVRKYPINENDDLRDGDLSDSDFETDDLRDGDSSDSDFESDDRRDGDSTDSDIMIDGLKDVDLSDLDIKIDGQQSDHSSGSDSESD